jgi:uncharacterized protein YjbI with pentapeptide repeats
MKEQFVFMNVKVMQTALLPPIASKRQGSIHATVGHNNSKKKGHHPNTPPLWETSRAQHCQAKRYSWAMENMTAQELLAAYATGERDFPEALLIKANLSGADLSIADLSGANLSGADLSGANLSGANLSRANLSEANPSYALFLGANLSRANLNEANLDGANQDGSIR